MFETKIMIDEKKTTLKNLTKQYKKTWKELEEEYKYFSSELEGYAKNMLSFWFTYGTTPPILLRRRKTEESEYYLYLSAFNILKRDNGEIISLTAILPSQSKLRNDEKLDENEKELADDRPIIIIDEKFVNPDETYFDLSEALLLLYAFFDRHLTKTNGNRSNVFISDLIQTVLVEDLKFKPSLNREDIKRHIFENYYEKAEF